MIKAQAVTLVLIGSILAACCPGVMCPQKSVHKQEGQKHTESPPPPRLKAVNGSGGTSPQTGRPLQQPVGGVPPENNKWIDPPEVV